MRQVICRLSCRATLLTLAALAALSILIVPCAGGQSAKDAAARAQATALFARAVSVTDIRAPGSPPFELRGAINVQSHGKGGANGEYLLRWASPTRWREEIAFHNYTRIRVGGENQYWQSRTTSHDPESILQLDQALDFLKRLHAWSNPASIAALKDVRFHHEKRNGVKLDCVSLIPNGLNFGPDFCFDAANGSEVSDMPGPNDFSGSVTFHGKHFPGSIRAEEAPAVPVTMIVNSISPLNDTRNEDFQPPQGATAWPSCDEPDAVPVIQRGVAPEYPTNEKLSHEEGSVFFYGVIGADGRLTQLAVLSTPDEAFAQSALTAASQWMYSPETCHGVPVPVEVLERITYDLAY